MADQSIFEEGGETQQQQQADQQTAAQQDTSTATFQLPDGVDEYVGEGKKYKTAEDALKSIPHAQRHVQTLEKELAELREKVNKATTLDEVLEKMKPQEKSAERPSVQELNPSAIAEIVQQQLLEEKSKEVQEQNQAQVISKLTERFGDKAEEQYINKAKELNLSITDMNSLARKSPAVVLAAFKEAESPAPSRTEANSTTSIMPSGDDGIDRTKAPITGATTKDLVNVWKACHPDNFK